MFYSETLLSKTGPLARVWLSANLERKLSKTHILQSNIESSISAIVDQGQAPMALRLSGQLLLGVVRIYSRKARYLLDDCNEALLKLKMAFRPGNVDLPPNQTHAQNSAALTLPDVLTELDLLPPLPDTSLLLDQPFGSADLDFGQDKISLHDDTTLLDQTRLFPGVIERGRDAPEEPLVLEDEELELDLGLGDDLADDVNAGGNDTSIHVGRDAPPSRALEDEFANDGKYGGADDLWPDVGGDTTVADTTVMPGPVGEMDEPPQEQDGMDIDMDLGPNGHLDALHTENPATPGPSNGRERESLSPLSDIRASEERELERVYHRNLDFTFVEPEAEEETVHQPQRMKHRKAIQPDANTILASSHIKQLQEDRSRILKPSSLLPRDPLLLTLMNMQRNGGFVSSILGDGRGKGWAPELRGILSLEVVRKSGEMKRKHDDKVDMNGFAEEVASPRSEKRPRLEIFEDEELHIPDVPEANFEPDMTIRTDGEIIELAADDSARLASPIGSLDQDRGVEDEAAVGSPLPNNTFDDTIAPLVEPADSGPVSLGTKHAVHLLRDRFGSSAAGSPSERRKATVLFQELLPEQSTTKADATKMFFEVLVLATKDAVKVEQEEGVLSGPIRVRGRRGLWGAWAEMEAEGEAANSDSPAASGQVAVEA